MKLLQSLMNKNIPTFADNYASAIDKEKNGEIIDFDYEILHTHAYIIKFTTKKIIKVVFENEKLKNCNYRLEFNRLSQFTLYWERKIDF
jgi:hypothetical protein